jgi:hypothetical protein
VLLVDYPSLAGLLSRFVAAAEMRNLGLDAVLEHGARPMPPIAAMRICIWVRGNCLDGCRARHVPPTPWKRNSCQANCLWRQKCK